jgi:hypothetical protein
VIAAGLPDEKHFSLSAVTLNLAGYSYFGETSEIRAYLADRYSNPVPVGTPIFFESEAGAMALTQALTNEVGQAYGTQITQAPYPDTISADTGLRGLSKILAWTAGQESFVDYNGNGLYDSGEPFGDRGEPFIDANDNGSYDAAAGVGTEERYVDINGNGKYDGPNGIWNGDTYIWTDIDILWSYAKTPNIIITATPDASCANFVIESGATCEVTVVVKDTNGNPLIGGSSLNMEYTTAYVDITPRTITIPDTLKPGSDSTEFIISIRNLNAFSVDNTDTAVFRVDGPVDWISTPKYFSKSKSVTVTSLKKPEPTP